MQFQQQLVTEIIAPNNVPFQPGNNVTGFGSSVPPELVAAGFSNAIVFYATDWNPASTSASVKFRFIAANSQGLQFGFGYASNPSVSQTATIVRSETISTFLGVGSDVYVAFKNSSGHPVFEFDDVSGGPDFFINADDGVNRRVSFQVFSDKSSQLVLGTNQDDVAVSLVHDAGASVFRTNNYFTFDTSWTAIPLTNSWISHTDSPARYRRMPDGTVMFKGIIVKTSANPTNGEAWMSGLPAAYRPAFRTNFHTSCAFRSDSATQKAEVKTDGTAVIWDPAAALGDMILDTIRYAVI